ncbi:hypothetical protein NDU88_005969 [Pleurodeles waltl]|uniref:Uncharacterized protein n=1 Tax=Pleurodeles waltl TaxID=8319 RepID=A0AAV7TYW8_PLEWA|nr:hypothetical protein NDU88_005969 [Pleurodeles waltl]
MEAQRQLAGNEQWRTERTRGQRRTQRLLQCSIYKWKTPQSPVYDLWKRKMKTVHSRELLYTRRIGATRNHHSVWGKAASS